jgi:hypothetical protein
VTDPFNFYAVDTGEAAAWITHWVQTMHVEFAQEGGVGYVLLFKQECAWGGVGVSIDSGSLLTVRIRFGNVAVRNGLLL